MDKYCIGVDFGTLSARAVLVDVHNGEELAFAVKEYARGVICENLPHGFALQHPADYIEALGIIIPQIIKSSDIDPLDISGIGIDFTACTMIPLDRDTEPLCFDEKFMDAPHAFAKLWKHHASQPEADRITEIALKRGEAFLSRYGGRISSEWMLPKIWQILNESPGIYHATHKFIEAADWIVFKLTGNERRNNCAAGYKALWSKRDGYPSKDFFKALDPRLEDLVDEKLSREIYPIGSKAGEITAEAAKLTGLAEGTTVAVANVDAHAAFPAMGLTKPGKMLMIMGTSTCHMILAKEDTKVPGICGALEDGIIEGFIGYEAGQPCTGDMLDWYVQNLVPARYLEQADIHSVLSKKASFLRPGQSGLLALDWWNGNRSVLNDADLSGVVLGCTLSTRPEELYRALLEAVSFGTRLIIDTFEESGIYVDELYATGGIAEKNELLMQICADVTDRRIWVSGSSNSSALGSAIFAAKASGIYDSIREAVKKMGRKPEKYFIPIHENVIKYKKLYQEYRILHDYFGKGGNDVMKRLKNI